MSIDDLPPIDSEILFQPEESPPEPATTKIYPSILQSFAIALLMVALILIDASLMLLSGRSGDENAALLHYGVSMGLAFLIIHRTRKGKTGSSTYDFRIPSLTIIPLIAFGTIVLLFGIVSPISSLIPVPEVMKRALQGAIASAGPATLLYFVVLAPVLEELIFRGVMLDGLLRRYSPATAILVSSFLFGAIHLNPWQFVAGFVLGCFFGWVYYRTGSVALCMIGHMTANGIGFVVRLAMQAAGKGIGDVEADATTLATVFALSCPVVLLTVYVMSREFRKDRYTRVERLAFPGGETLQAEPGILPDATADGLPSDLQPAQEFSPPSIAEETRPI